MGFEVASDSNTVGIHVGLHRLPTLFFVSWISGTEMSVTHVLCHLPRTGVPVTARGPRAAALTVVAAVGEEGVLCNGRRECS